jgi:hypothetical protein
MQERRRRLQERRLLHAIDAIDANDAIHAASCQEGVPFDVHHGRRLREQLPPDRRQRVVLRFDGGGLLWRADAGVSQARRRRSPPAELLMRVEKTIRVLGR